MTHQHHINHFKEAAMIYKVKVRVVTSFDSFVFIEADNREALTTKINDGEWMEDCALYDEADGESYVCSKTPFEIDAVDAAPDGYNPW
jgi:hypothetical protein